MKESIFPGNLREKVTDSILSNSPDRVYFPLLWFSLGKSICCDSRHIFTAVGEYLPYKATRFQIAHLELDDNRQHVLVLDHIAKLSAQKLNLMQYLAWEKRFR